MHDASEYFCLPDNDLLDQCSVQAYRASGPGGQKRNKTSSAVRLQHVPTGLSAIAEEDRSQHVNKRRALKRLRKVLATELLTEPALSPDEVSAMLRGHISEGKLAIHPKHEEFLLLSRELLSFLHAAAGHVGAVAELIGVSTASLIRFLELDLHVWRKANQIRQSNQLHALRSGH